MDVNVASDKESTQPVKTASLILCRGCMSGLVIKADGNERSVSIYSGQKYARKIHNMRKSLLEERLNLERNTNG